MADLTQKSSARGLTLVELLVALAVLGIISSIASSGFGALRQILTMYITINNLAHSFHMARQASLSRGHDIVICRSATSAQCETDADWTDGWLMFANTDRDAPPTRDANEAVLATGHAVTELQISANRQAFVLRPHGLRSTNGTFILCDKRGSAHARALIVSYTGKPRLSRTTSSGKALQCAG